jgi:hypothetical protein
MSDGSRISWCRLVVVGVKQVQRTVGGTAGGRQRRAADAENLVEQFAVVELFAGIAGIDEIADEVRARADTALVDDDLSSMVRSKARRNSEGHGAPGLRTESKPHEGTGGEFLGEVLTQLGVCPRTGYGAAAVDGSL